MHSPSLFRLQERAHALVIWYPSTMGDARPPDVGTFEDFECALCHDLWFDPCVAPCGHVFCRACLRRCVDASRATCLKCPLCRRPLHVVAKAELVACDPLGRLLEDRFPDEYARRRTEHVANMEAEEAAAAGARSAAQEVAELSLFVADVVLPRQRLHLNVFEPRYCAMVRAAMDGGRRFGIVGQRGPGLRCGVEVLMEECAPQLDGRFLVQVRGTRAFRTAEACEHRDGYMVAKVQFVPVEAEECRREDVAAAQELLPLIAEWEDLVRSAWPQHLVAIHNDLGPLPSAECPGDRALWAAALVNPQPPLGIAPEIGPEVLAAEDVQVRLRIVRSGLEQSLSYLRSRARSPMGPLGRCLHLVSVVPPQMAMIIAVIAACAVSVLAPAAGPKRETAD